VKIWKAFSTGIKKINHHKRIWFLLYGIQFVLALILVLPLRSQWNAMIGHSLAGQEVLQGFGANVFIEFITHYAQTVSSEMILLFVIGLVYLTLTLFLNGGILGSFSQKYGEYSANVFFKNCGHYFGRFVRLFLFSLLFIAGAFLALQGLETPCGRIAKDSEPLRVIFWLARHLILLFLVFFINMVFDYAKIMTVLEERRYMIKTGLRAWGFVLKHLWKTLGLYCLVATIGLAFFVLYTLAGKSIEVSTGLGVLLLFLWQQLYALGRTWVRLLFLASQVTLYKGTSEPVLLGE